MRVKLHSAAPLCGALVFMFVCSTSACGQGWRQALAADEPPNSPPQSQPDDFQTSFNAIAPSVAATSASSSSAEVGFDAVAGGEDKPWEVEAAGQSHQQPFSRIGIGANISPLGIGINATTVLSDYFDARLMGNFFNDSIPEFEIDGFRTTPDIHLDSMAASLDWYPLNSVIRVSPGLMFYNGNQISISALIVAGNSFKLNGQTFYSANANPATGATPLTGTGVLGLHTQVPAFTIAGGFSKFVPRSNRHWSFPAEFGVVFMGAPSINVATSGWVCTDQAQTQCSSVSNSASTVGQEFNSQLQAQLVKWRADAAKVKIYPMFSYSLVYSFNIR